MWIFESSDQDNRKTIKLINNSVFASGWSATKRPCPGSESGQIGSGLFVTSLSYPFSFWSNDQMIGFVFDTKEQIRGHVNVNQTFYVLSTSKVMTPFLLTNATKQEIKKTVEIVTIGGNSYDIQYSSQFVEQPFMQTKRMQKLATKIARIRGGWLLVGPTGTGKTEMCVLTAFHLLNSGSMNPVIIRGYNPRRGGHWSSLIKDRFKDRVIIFDLSEFDKLVNHVVEDQSDKQNGLLRSTTSVSNEVNCEVADKSELSPTLDGICNPMKNPNVITIASSNQKQDFWEQPHLNFVTRDCRLSNTVLINSLTPQEATLLVTNALTSALFEDEKDLVHPFPFLFKRTEESNLTVAILAQAIHVASVHSKFKGYSRGVKKLRQSLNEYLEENQETNQKENQDVVKRNETNHEAKDEELQFELLDVRSSTSDL